MRDFSYIFLISFFFLGDTLVRLNFVLRLINFLVGIIFIGIKLERRARISAKNALTLWHKFAQLDHFVAVIPLAFQILDFDFTRRDPVIDRFKQCHGSREMPDNKHHQKYAIILDEK